MPKPRLAINKGLPARWSVRRGAFYFSVPPGLEPSWDGKQLFRLGRTLAEAHAEFGRRLGPQRPRGQTYGDVIARYLREETPAKSEASQTNDAYAGPQLQATFGDIPLDTPFKPTWAYQYVDQRVNPKTGKPAPGQGRKEISLMSSMLTAAVRWGWLDSNPMIGQVRFKGSNAPKRYVTDDEFLQALELAPPWLQVYLWLKLATGLRQKDLCALTWGDVDDVKGEVKVTPSKTARTTGKTLIFELDVATLAELDRLMPADPDPALPVFRSSRGHAFVKSSFQSAWDRLQVAVIAAGGRRFTEHDIRGKVGSDAVSLESARQRLGHASAAVTLRHYRRAAERIKAGG